MPISDPDKKRAYERNYRRRERAQKRLGELVDLKRSKVSGVPTVDLETVDKLELGRQLINRGRSVLLSEEMPLTAKDALDLLREGVRLVDSVAAQAAQIEARSAPVDISGILANPAAMAAAMELLRYARPGANAATDNGAAKGDPGPPGGPLHRRRLGPISAPATAPAGADEGGDG
jgi:hypothetical protein